MNGNKLLQYLKLCVLIWNLSTKAPYLQSEINADSLENKW